MSDHDDLQKTIDETKELIGDCRETLDGLAPHTDIQNGLKRMMPERIHTNANGEYEVPIFTRCGSIVATIAIQPFLTFHGVSVIWDGRIFTFDTEARQLLECCPVVPIRTIDETIAAQGGRA